MDTVLSTNWISDCSNSVGATGTPFVPLTDASTVSWPVTGLLSNAAVTLNGSRTLSITGANSGWHGTLFLTQGAGGSFGLTLPGTGSYVSAGGNGAITLSTAAGAIDKLDVIYDGNNFYYTLVKNYTANTTTAPTLVQAKTCFILTTYTCTLTGVGARHNIGYYIQTFAQSTSIAETDNCGSTYTVDVPTTYHLQSGGTYPGSTVQAGRGVNSSGGSCALTSTFNSGHDAVLVMWEFTGSGTFDVASTLNYQATPGTGANAVVGNAQRLRLITTSASATPRTFSSREQTSLQERTWRGPFRQAVPENILRLNPLPSLLRPASLRNSPQEMQGCLRTLG